MVHSVRIDDVLFVGDIDTTMANRITDSYDTAPILRLPDKLLEDVWLELKAIWLEPRMLNANADVTAPPLYPWLVVSRVCKHWRLLAFSCSRLWSYIIAAEPEQVATLLRSSREAPLTIQSAEFTMPTYSHKGLSRRVMNTTFKLIAEESVRIVRLHLNLNARITRAFAACHYRGQVLDLSHLQVLHIDIDHVPSFLPGLSGITLPRPKKLVVNGKYFVNRRNIALVRTLSVGSLTSLTMNRVYWNRQELLDILSRTVSLQHLSLAAENVKHNDIDQTCLRVALPHLETIHISGVAGMPLIESLATPSAARLSLYFCRMMYPNPFEDFCDTVKDLKAIVTHARLRLTTCSIRKIGGRSLYHKVYMDLWTEQLTLEDLAHHGAPPPKPSLRAELTRVRSRNAFHTYVDAIRSSVAREVSTLYVAHEFVWDDLADYGPSLRKLGSYDTRGAFQLLDVLLRSCLLAVLPFTLHSMFFPLLEELMLNNVDWRSLTTGYGDLSTNPVRPAQLLLDVLRLRETQGNRLKRVLITNPANLESCDVEMLQSADVADAIIVLRKP